MTIYFKRATVYKVKDNNNISRNQISLIRLNYQTNMQPYKFYKIRRYNKKFYLPAYTLIKR